VASPDSVPVAVTYPVPTATGGPVGANGVSLATVACTPVSGSMFPVGTTEVRCTATAASQTASCTFPVTVTAPVARLTRTRFLAFGDSLTAGEVTQPTIAPQRHGERLHRLILVPSASYPTQLLSRLRARYTMQSAQIEVVNAGWPGEWAEDGAIRLPGMISTARPEVVLLLEGMNDLLALGAPGVPRAGRAIDLMAKEIRGRGARAFLATLPPTRPTVPQAVPLALVQALNAQIRSTALGEGAVLVDLYGALGSDVARYIGADGIHPTEAGYARIADTFLAAIRAELEPRP
jgi:lysophospholipase L1-like esterase